jgi:ABC-type maltose transport system permease subunit
MMLPMVTSGIAVYFAWSSIYLSNGPLNAMLRAVGLGFLAAERGWLGGPNTALPALMAVMIWSSVPFAVILYLAGLQTIDQELYEAAIMDGANSWHMLWYITWPLLRPVTVIILILAINSVLQTTPRWLVCASSILALAMIFSWGSPLRWVGDSSWSYSCFRLRTCDFSVRRPRDNEQYPSIPNKFLGQAEFI